MQYFLKSEFFDNFLEPTIFFVGTTQKTVCFLNEFVAQGIWQMWCPTAQQRDYVDTIAPGHFLVAKQTQGTNKPSMLKAIGIALGFYTGDQDTLSVPTLWLLPKIWKEIPFQGAGSSISNPKPLRDIDQETGRMVKAARRRMLQAFHQPFISNEMRF